MAEQGYVYNRAMRAHSLVLPMAMGAVFPAPGLRQAVCIACRQPTALSASHQDLPACPACGRDTLRWDNDVIAEGWPHDRENFRGDPD